MYGSLPCATCPTQSRALNKTLILLSPAKTVESRRKVSENPRYPISSPMCLTGPGGCDTIPVWTRVPPGQQVPSKCTGSQLIPAKQPRRKAGLCIAS